MKIKSIIVLLFLVAQVGNAQINENRYGAWYMYFYSAQIKEGPWGIQGDAQHRNFNLGGDLEQLLLRSGLTYSPKNMELKLTAGYANITTGTYGESNETVLEHRIYQEALYPHKFGSRFYTNHRFRYEQRFVENQDFRSRYRYNLFLTIPINKSTIEKGTVYFTLYNEIFINAQRNIGNGVSVQYFDRNRFYTALGYVVKEGIKVQLGSMKQSTNSIEKSQLQLSLHSSF